MPDKPKLATRTNLILLVILIAVAAFLYLKPRNMFALISSAAAEPMRIGWEHIPSGYDETMMNNEFHYLRFKCFENKSQPILGDRACSAPIKNMNEIPATDVVFFSKNKEIKHIRIVLKEKHHRDAFDLFEKKFGKARVIKKNGDRFGNDIVGWLLPSGLIQMNPIPSPGEGQTIILWTSKKTFMDNVEKSVRDFMKQLEKRKRNKQPDSEAAQVESI